MGPGQNARHPRTAPCACPRWLLSSGAPVLGFEQFLISGIGVGGNRGDFSAFEAGALEEQTDLGDTSMDACHLFNDVGGFFDRHRRMFLEIRFQTLAMLHQNTFGVMKTKFFERVHAALSILFQIAEQGIFTNIQNFGDFVMRKIVVFEQEGF